MATSERFPEVDDWLAMSRTLQPIRPPPAEPEKTCPVDIPPRLQPSVDRPLSDPVQPDPTCRECDLVPDNHVTPDPCATANKPPTPIFQERDQYGRLAAVLEWCRLNLHLSYREKIGRISRMIPGSRWLDSNYREVVRSWKNWLQPRSIRNSMSLSVSPPLSVGGGSMTQASFATAENAAEDISDQGRNSTPLTFNPDTVLLAGLFIFATLTAAYLAADVILPIVLAIVLKLLLQPAMHIITRFRIPRTLAAIILIIGTLGLIIALGASVSGPAKDWMGRWPEGLPRLEERLIFLKRPIETIGSLLSKADSLGQMGSGPVTPPGFGITGMLFRGTQHFVSGLFETIVVLFFLLVYGETFLRRLVEILPRFKDKRQVVDISQQIESNISAYLITVTVMNIAVGSATAVVMWMCGVGDPVLWGVVAFLLNYVPILGPLAGVILFLFAGLLAVPVLWQAFLPAGLYFLIHVLEGEMVTPMLLARRFTLNPVLVIISLIFWFWMWGVPGAILSVPLLAITKILCDGIKPLNAIGHFLEGEERGAKLPLDRSPPNHHGGVQFFTFRQCRETPGSQRQKSSR
jgi:predicted PurR-regulated permease PerM